MESAVVEDRTRLGILSYAHTAHAMSYTHALTQLAGAEVAAIYDEDPKRGQALAHRFGVSDFYSAPEPLLARDDVEAVVVCSPTNTHAELVIAAAQAGKHVLCEKPIATQLADARAMIGACRKAGVQLHLAFVCRFYPMVQAAKEMIESGEIGQVYGMIGGNRGRPPLAPSYPSWITNPRKAGGGAVIDHSVHVTDAMRYLLSSEVESVFAEAGTLIHPELAVEDCGLMLLKFRNGVIASVDPSWSIPANNPYHYDFYIRILGMEGLISLDDTRQALRIASDNVQKQGAFLEPFGVNVDTELVRHFVHSIQQGVQLSPCASGEDGLRALEIALAAYESARSGQPVTLSSDA